MKKILMLAIITILVILPMTVFAASSGTCGDNLTWTLDEEGTVTISGTGDMYDVIDGFILFDDLESIKKVIIGDGVTSIASGLFYNCNNLTSITISDSVTSIGDLAFYGCENLANITIGTGVTSIGEGAFYGCSAQSIVIPDNVITIGEIAFAWCHSLKSAIIGSGVTSIGYLAFGECYNLTDITISNGVTYIGDYMFGGCFSLTSVTIPKSVTSIGDNAFDHCKSLTSFTIPDNITNIGSNAFSNCTNLTSLYVPVHFKDQSIKYGTDNVIYYCTVTYTGAYEGEERVDYGSNATLLSSDNYILTVDGEEWDGTNITQNVTVEVSSKGINTEPVWSYDINIFGTTIRFIFDVKIDGDVITGIKYVKVTGTEADYEAANGVGGGSSKTFYGEVTDVPEDAVFYAVAYVTKDGKTYWSVPQLGKLK